MLRVLTAFVLAVLVTAMSGSVIQSLCNLLALRNLGASIPLTAWFNTLGYDLLNFGPVYAALVTVAFAPALAVAAGLSRLFGHWRLFIYATGGVLSLLLSFQLVDALAPMPTLIAATRSLMGTLLMAASGALGTCAFALLIRPTTARGAQ
ncbi:MAG TPA: hypothetical protein VIC08_09740 [Cellvibrionaceae bacterium]